MRNIYLALLAFLLGVSLVNAELSCTGDTTPNLATTLKINCTTEVSQSRCYTIVYDNSTIPIILGEYPPSCFGEDRICINTFDDGSFISNVFINDKIFYTGTNYTASVKCFNPADNSTNETSFIFAPTGYASPDWLAEVFISLGNNAIYIIALVILIAVSVIGYVYLRG
jgi:hypothetical protein